MRTMFSVVLSVLSSAFLLACTDDGLGDHSGGSALVADVDAGGSTTDSNADIGTDTGSPDTDTPDTHECDHESGRNKGFGTSPSRP